MRAGRGQVWWLLGTLIALGVAVMPSSARAGSLGRPSELATPTFTTPVAAAGGVAAWAAPSGRGHRFEVVIRRGGRTHGLVRTSAVGWIDGLKLGTDSRGRAIVVYSHCPHSPFGPDVAGAAGTDGCLLWWAPLAGGRAPVLAGSTSDVTLVCQSFNPAVDYGRGNMTALVAGG